MTDILKAAIISAGLLIVGFLAVAVAALLLPAALYGLCGLVVWVVIQIDKSSGQEKPKPEEPKPKD